MIYFFDSSALAKRYVSEAGTDWVRNILAGAKPEEVFISKISGAEVAAAFARKKRSGEISEEDHTKASGGFRGHFRVSYTHIEVTDEVVDIAMELAERQALRGYDAVQLASAALVSRSLEESKEDSLTFVSADDRLCEAARAEKIAAENPNN
jgi:predicted nucleic acid-binding protein